MRISRCLALCFLVGGMVVLIAPVTVQAKEIPSQASMQEAATVGFMEKDDMEAKRAKIAKAEKDFYAKTDAVIPRDVLCSKDETRVRAVAAEMRRDGELEAAIKVCREAFVKYTEDVKIEDWKQLEIYLDTMGEHFSEIGFNIALLEKEWFGETFGDYDLGKRILNHNADSIHLERLSKLREEIKERIEKSNLSAEDLEVLKSETSFFLTVASSDDKDGPRIKVLPKAVYNLNDVYFTDRSKAELEGNLEYLRKYYPQENESILEHEIKLARCQLILGDAEQALSMVAGMLPKVESAFGKKSEPTLIVLETMQEAYETLGRYAESKRTAEKIVRLQTEMYGENAPQTLSGKKTLIHIRVKLGDYEKAREELKLILPLADQLLPEKDSAKVGLHILEAAICCEMGDPFDAMEMKIPDCSSESIWENKKCEWERYRVQSRVRKNVSEYGTALKNELSLLNDELTMLDADHCIVLSDMCSLCDSYLRIGFTDDALRLASAVYRMGKVRYGELHPCTVKAMLTLADAHRAARNWRVALDMDTHAHELCKTIFGADSLETLDTLIKIGTDYEKAGDFPSAISNYNDALNRLRKQYRDNFATRALVMTQLAGVYDADGEYGKAIALCRKIKEMSPDTIWAKYNATLEPNGLKASRILAHAYKASGQIKNAIECYEDLQAVYEVIRDSFGLHGEELSQWFSLAVPIYRELASAYVLDNRNGSDVLRNLDLCKARNLISQYMEETALRIENVNIKEAERLNENKRLLAIHKKAANDALNENEMLYLSIELSRIKIANEYTDAYDTLKRNNPQYDDFKFIIKDKTQSIPKDACFIDYSVMREGDGPDAPTMVIACIASYDGKVNAVPIPVGRDFTDQCHAYHELLAYPTLQALNKSNKYLWIMPDGNYKVVSGRNRQGNGAVHIGTEKGFAKAREELSAALGATLLEAIETQIPADVSRWIISPDGVLNNVPFETLQYNGKMVIETKDVSYVPSLSVMKMMQDLAATHAQMPSRRELFAMGDAVYGGHAENEHRGSVEDMGNYLAKISQDADARSAAADVLSKLKWNDLPGTAKELDRVSSLFDEERQHIVRGREASEGNLKAFDKQGELGQYKYFLFATHGLYVPEMPQLSSIVLSQDGKSRSLDYENDGYVTVGEWMGYKLNSDLVYLSACESGLGKYQPGEGIMGIPYGLCVAGNQNTVMSLWKVEDDSTAEFSKSFFQKISQGESQARALSETKREFLMQQGYENPSIWSAFLLYGI